MNEALATITAMDFDPFPGSVFVGDDKLLADSMVKARGKYACFHCLGPIATKEVHRCRNERIGGRYFSNRWCALCCAAMVAQLLGELDGKGAPALPFERRNHWQTEAVS